MVKLSAVTHTKINQLQVTITNQKINSLMPMISLRNDDVAISLKGIRSSKITGLHSASNLFFFFNHFNLFSLFQQSEHFSFLGINNQSNLTDMRCRTTFYTALGRLLMVDLGTTVNLRHLRKESDIVLNFYLRIENQVWGRSFLLFQQKTKLSEIV